MSDFLHRVMCFFWKLRITKWRLYFKPNGPREWTNAHFTGFRELHDSLDLAAQWVVMTNTGDHYYTACTLSEPIFRFMSKETKANYAKAKQDEAERRIYTYLKPECRCRVGFHWKCGIHYTWSN